MRQVPENLELMAMRREVEKASDRGAAIIIGAPLRYTSANTAGRHHPARNDLLRCRFVANDADKVVVDLDLVDH